MPSRHPRSGLGHAKHHTVIPTNHFDSALNGAHGGVPIKSVSFCGARAILLSRHPPPCELGYALKGNSRRNQPLVIGVRELSSGARGARICDLQGSQDGVRADECREHIEEGTGTAPYKRHSKKGRKTCDWWRSARCGRNGDASGHLDAAADNDERKLKRFAVCMQAFTIR
jgi:hypothetical protein